MMKKITSLSTDVVNICYFGGLHLGRDVELCRFAKYLRENICPNISVSVKLKVYTFSRLSDDVIKQFKKYRVELCDGLTGDILKSKWKHQMSFFMWNRSILLIIN